MSAFGYKQTSSRPKMRSALPPTRDIPGEAGKSDIDPGCIGPGTGRGLAQQSTGRGWAGPW